MWGKRSFRPRLIYSTTSPLSGKINIWQQGEERILEVGGYAQSVSIDAGDLENRFWGRMAEESARRVTNPESVLILGLGGGTVAHLLAKKFPGIIIDGVELDPAIVKVGERYFALNEIPNLRVIVADAYRLVQKPESHGLRAITYPIIIVDLYLGGKWSPELEEVEFLQALKRLLAKDGVATFNRVYGSNRQQFRTTSAKVFAKIEEVKVRFKSLPSGNTLYLCR